MNQYTSTRGGIDPVDFDEAVLQGFAKDGGLFVPTTLPQFSYRQLEFMSELPYKELAFEILSRLIPGQIIPKPDLRSLIQQSFSQFSHPDVIPVIPLKLPDLPNGYIMELFHGPTLSFKDIAMGFLINTMDYLLEKRKEHLNLILATTGDTGPAAAHAAAGKKHLHCWPLYPSGMISREQEAQMTGLSASNILPLGVKNCPDGGDDLDIVVARLFADETLKNRLNLSSVNSINWCRVMFQSIHYFYGYFRVCNSIGDPVVFSVPSGAFGNLFAGNLARLMGLPVDQFICANNQNQTLHRAFSKGKFTKFPLQQTLSSAIDIVVPYNFWRFLYFACGQNPKAVQAWMDEFDRVGEIDLGPDLTDQLRKTFSSASISDPDTLKTIRSIWEDRSYLLDPHGAVALAAALRRPKDPAATIICLATAHPAKFPEVTRQALGGLVPEAGLHPSLERAKQREQKGLVCDCSDLESVLIDSIESSRETILRHPDTIA